jgi:hypothetical protein
MTPKSCSCNRCRQGKAGRRGKLLLRWQRRVFRHAAKQAVRLAGGGDPVDLMAAPKGERFD